MRVNLVNPELLTDQHLLAEYNELNMVASAYNKRKKVNEGVPNSYKLGEGHVKFFYDKGEYLYRRFYKLKYELLKRGFNVKQNFKNYWLANIENFNDWEPKENDYNVIYERIRQKVLSKPNFYRYNRKKINVDEYLKFLGENLNTDNQQACL